MGQGNLVVNGNFEAGAQGWTFASGARVSGSTGGHGLVGFLASSNSLPSLQPTASQLINGLLPGTTYHVFGDYKAEKDRGGASSTNASFGIAFNGNYLFEITSTPVGDWQSFSFFYTANSFSAMLSLSSQINGTGVEYTIDNIQMQVVPEPSAWALASWGVLLFAARHRRRKPRKTSHSRLIIGGFQPPMASVDSSAR